ncbi:MAG: ATP-dependent RecD-like DNA helicase [Planctomycetes bacterium]|nr:ATP-dependent RecD-like DNA helicase [Planctomycetota bacterium]
MAQDDVLQGTVRGEVFRREDGGFAVLMLESDTGVVSVTGPLPVAHPGEVLEATGEWVMDPRFGRQFRAREAKVAPPGSAAAIVRYLGSGAIHGVGPETARRIVERFGDDTLRVLDEDPARLREVKGIGRKRLKQIEAGWAAQRATREAMLFLRGHGFGPVLAEKIHAKYGAATRGILEDDPFQLAREVDGVGFLTADRLARAIGMKPDDPRRVRAGLLHVVNEALGSGHVAVPAPALLEEAGRLLHTSETAALEAGLRAAREGLDLELDRPPGEAEVDVVYLPQVLRAERGAAQRTARLVQPQRRRAPVGDVRAAVAWLASEHGLALTDAQADAVQACLEAPLVVITGGPGVGKTTVLRALVRVLEAKRAKLALAAPTGRAAKRMEEATGARAQTLHRLLGWDPQEGGFVHGQDDPLDVDLLVIDEASMVDVRLYHAVVRALPPGATLVLTGDVDQLPSVGPGAVLKDLIASGAAHVVRLTEVFRQAARSRIVGAAHAINRGEVPPLEHDPTEETDFFFVARDDPAEAQRAIVKLVTERIPGKFGLDPIEAVQVLSPMRRGACGTDALNAALRAALLGRQGDPPEPGRLDAGDKVMQLRNDYDHDVYNGDIGRVVRREDTGEVIVAFDGREVRYTRGEAARLALSYCATIHKAQGSEYPAVVVPVLTEHFVMLERNLIYTALTRARRLAILVGQRRALEMAVQNDRPRQRVSHLAARIKAALAGGG